MRNRESGTGVGVWLTRTRKNLFADSGSGLGERMSMKGCKRVNFMRGEAARAVSTFNSFFEGEAKGIKRGHLVHMFENGQSQSGKPQRP